MAMKSGWVIALPLLALTIGAAAAAPGDPNYYERRYEEGIRHNLDTYYEYHSLIDAKDIQILVDGNTVILRGTVENRRVRDLAVEAAQRTNGVYNVIDELEVRSPGLPAGVLAAAPAPDRFRPGPTDVNLAEQPR